MSVGFPGIGGGGQGAGGGGGGGNVSTGTNNTFTANNGFSGELYRIAATASTSTLDVTKAALNRALSASETEAFSATPSTDLQFPVFYTTTGGPWTVNWGVVVYSYARQTNLQSTGIVIPANGTYAVVYNYSLARAQWEISCDPVLVTGLGSFVLNTNPVLVTPNIGAATGSSLALSGIATGTVASFNNYTIVASSLGYSSTTNFDFAALTGIQDETLTGNVTFTTSNLAAGKSITARLLASGGTRTLAFPSWIFIGSAAPSSLTSGKYAVLTLSSFGTTDANVVAAYSAQP